MTDEPILPVRGYAYRDEMEIPASLVVYASDIGERVPVVVVSLTPASWRAMVERGARARWNREDADYCKQLEDTPTPWSAVVAADADECRKAAEADLRAAFNLPDGWTP